MSDSDHSTDIGTIAYLHGVESGKDFERAKIVAWLMNEESDYRSTKYAGFVEIIRKEIEAGEHLK